jgi:conjugative transfer region lipoprotein (TIGR03751 family)
MTLIGFTLLGGCATSKDELLPHGDNTMLDIWDQETGGGAPTDRRLADARQSLRRPLTEADVHEAPAVAAAYTRTAANEIQRQFHRLPNPDLVMYVFPHLAGTDPVPVPGYSTVFPLYRRAPYAMPGERLEDY